MSSPQKPGKLESGPVKNYLPNPEILRQYNEVAPGLAQEIIDQVNLSITSRYQNQERREVREYDLQKREQRMQGLAQVFAFLVAITAIGGGLWLAGYRNQPITGGLVTGGSVVAIATAFIRTRRPK